LPEVVLLLPKQENSLPKQENKLPERENKMQLLHVIFPDEKNKP
jgi:hypothetical protein